MPLLELTKIISRKFLLSPLRPLIPAPPNAFLLRDIGELRVTSEFSLFVFLFQIQVFIQDLTQITNEIKKAETAATNAPSAMS